MKKESLIALKDISKTFDEVQIIEKLNLNIKEREFLTFLGPSGSGKTTLLRMIAGFEEPTGGEIIFDGKVINKIPAHKRLVDTVFQNYALFPHMDVYGNIAFGLKLKKYSKVEIEKKVKEILKLVNLEGYEKRRITALSGGQQQRVAIARALVNKPRVLLLDEPLSALDLKLRQDMQRELKEMQKNLDITFIYVTHDQEEALTMSDTIVVLDQGKIQQIGTPEEIYNKPQNSFVASFIGDSNVFNGTITENKLKFARLELELSDHRFKDNSEVDIVVRPEDIILLPPKQGNLKGVIDSVSFKGNYYEIIIKEDQRTWKVQSVDLKEKDEKVGIKISLDNIHIMNKQ